MYDPAAYDTLPSLREAADLLDDNVKKHLNGAIRTHFLKNSIEDKLGLVLLHKHFGMERTQRLVDYNHTSAVWNIGDDCSSNTPKYSGLIVPRSFRLFDGQIVPYEFEYSTSEPCIDEGSNAKVFELLSKLGLQDVLGVRHLDQYDPSLSVEVTEGSTNIMIPRGSVSDEDLIEVMWTFSPDENQKCHCREFCMKQGKDHVENHGCS